MFFSRRRMSFDPYSSKKQKAEANKEQNQSTTVYQETETVGATVVTAPVAEASVVSPVVETVPEVAVVAPVVETVPEVTVVAPVVETVPEAPVVQENLIPEQPVVESAVVENPVVFDEKAIAEEPAVEDIYWGISLEPEEKEMVVPEEVTEAAVEDTIDFGEAYSEIPSLEESDEEAQAGGIMMNDNVLATKEDKFAKEKEQMEYEVIIGKNTSFKGEINIDGATRIDGHIEGTVCVNNDMFIGETGHIEGDIKVINATVSGTIVGNIKCSSRLELLSTSSISGDIQCGALIVAEGASINATVACGKAIVEAEPAPAPVEATPVAPAAPAPAVQ